MTRGPIEFEIGGFAYKARRMDIFTQGDIARKVAPLVASGVVQFARAASTHLGAGKGSPRLGEAITLALSLPMDKIAEMAVPFLRDFAAMTGDDYRFVIRECLRTVQRNNGTATSPKWADVWPDSLAQPLFAEFQDDLFHTLSVVIAVIQGTLGNFTPGSR